LLRAGSIARLAQDDYFGLRQGRATMHLALQNAETINRLVEQGEFLLKSFHDEHQNDPAGAETEFARGELIGWRSTLHTLYRDYAEDIVNRVVTRTRLTIPDGEAPSGATHAA
jgi:hypothetical protein